MPQSVKEVEILESSLMGDGGFARLRRCTVRNLREDGSQSELYPLDILERPVGADAVAVVAYESLEQGRVRVLLRRGLRPVPRLGRGGHPTREGEIPDLMHLEVVAGILEEEDIGEEGLGRRASLELLEEAGLRVSPDLVEPLGPPVYNSLGIMAERIYLCAVAAGLEDLEAPEGDGTPLEEGSTPEVYWLEEALGLCANGQIQDAKTELILRRLAAQLESGGRGGSPLQGKR